MLLPIYQDNKTTIRYAFKLAGCYQWLNKNNEALTIINELKHSNVRGLPPNELLDAIYFSNNNQLDKALNLFLTIEKNIQHLPELYLMMGNTCALLNDWNNAEYYFLKVVSIQTENTQALANLIYALNKQNKSSESFEQQLELLSKSTYVNFKNTYEFLHELDFNPDRTIDFRKYQLTIRLFLEQFHKGVKHLN